MMMMMMMIIIINIIVVVDYVFIVTILGIKISVKFFLSAFMFYVRLVSGCVCLFVCVCVCVCMCVYVCVLAEWNKALTLINKCYAISTCYTNHFPSKTFPSQFVKKPPFRADHLS